ncbi:histidine kinase [Propionibacterium ruminifibrarum]|uniref:histidine kinase n=1 Tax=Propionibacterium ruminifibrarum TaxID=1962131 RepID=A0A375I1A0_9ACTN|nr:sensor histidine kinase [Propionibacterium ruminifibrarum]SPF67365.1 histidine kinase [Propionibacterium ruminifibrarum]
MTGHHVPAPGGGQPVGGVALPVTELLASLTDVVAQVHATLGPDQSGLCVHRNLTAARCQTVQMQTRPRPVGELKPMTCLLDPGSTCILAGPRLKCPRAMDEKDVVRVGFGKDDEFGWLWHAHLGGTDPARRQAEELVLVAMAGMAERLISRAIQADDSEARMIAGERERISRELHDGVAQVLGSAHLRLSALAGQEELGDETVSELTQISQDCAMAYADVREAIWDLHMPEEMTGSLASGIRSTTGAFERRTGITCRVELADPGISLPAGTRLQLLRVVQEALTNVRKHAHASTVDVTMRTNPNSITINISDDGIGFEDPEPAPGHFGLLSMRERIEGIGGRLSIMSIPGAGTCVSAVVPLALSDESPREERTRV